MTHHLPTSVPLIELRITPEQARAVAAALDLYARMGLGQFEELAYLIRSGDIPLASQTRSPASATLSSEQRSVVYQQAEDACRTLKHAIGLYSNGSYGIGSPAVTLTTRRCFEVGKTIDKVLAMHRDPNPTFRGVNYDGVIVRYTEDPLPVCSVITENVSLETTPSRAEPSDD